MLTFSFDREVKTIAEETSQTLQGPPLPKETSNLPSELQDKQDQTISLNPSEITGFILYREALSLYPFSTFPFEL